MRFRRIATRRGQQRALIAVAHTILVICWHMLTGGATYTEPSPDHLAGNGNPDQRRQLINQLDRLGYDVELTPA